MSTASVTDSATRSRISFEPLATIGFSCLVAAAYAPLLAQYAAQLWATAGYRLAPLVLVLSAIAFWKDVRLLDPPIEPRRRWAFVLPTGLAVALLALAIRTQMPEMAAASALSLALAGAMRWGRSEPVGRRLGPWILAALVLRPPADVDLLCFHEIARWTTAVAHRVLDALGVLHDLDGLSITIPSGTLFSGAMSYGLFSPWSCLAMTLAVCVWLRRRLNETVLVLVAGCGWFLLVDVLRICALVMLSNARGMSPAAGLAGPAVGFAALILFVLLIVSTDHLLALFGKALRLNAAKPTARSHTAIEPPVVNTMPTTTGMTLDASGQLIKVVSNSPVESLPQSTWNAPAAPEESRARHDRRIGGPLMAIAYGLLCLAQVVWLPTAQGAAAALLAAKQAALEIEMPADFVRWQLASPGAALDWPTDNGTPSDSSGQVVARWVYRREKLTFTLAVRAHDPAWQDAAVLWGDRGWQVDPPGNSPDENEPAWLSLAYREVRLSKPFGPGYACVWESCWNPVEKSLSKALPGGWQAAATVSAEQAEGMWKAATSLSDAYAARRGAAGNRLSIQGSLVSFSKLTPAELNAGRELYCHLVAKLKRAMETRKEQRP